MAAKTAVHPVPDAEMKAKTGKTWDQWFKVLDDFGGPPKGRREIGNFLHDTHKVDPAITAMINVEYEAARGVVEKDGRPKGYMICATKTVAATPAKAYELFATGSSWTKWFAKGCKVELSEGGKYSSGEGHTGEIKKVRPAKAIKLTWDHPKLAPGTIVEVTFQPKGEKCTVMAGHDRIQTKAEADALRESWGAAFERLKALLEK
ncbi:MAG: SRPBCC family protein [Phycisphaerales bacterium]